MDYDLIVVKTLERVYKNYYYIIRGIKIYYGDNYGATQENNAYKVDDLGGYCMFA